MVGFLYKIIYRIYSIGRRKGLTEIRGKDCMCGVEVEEGNLSLKE